MYLGYNTRGNTTLNGKEKVFLCMTESDHSRYADDLIKDILDASDVAVYYLVPEKSDNTIEIEKSQLSDYLSGFSVFFFAVTLPMLGNDRISDTVLSYVRGNKPYIPIMLEDNLLDLYNKKFGDIQFLDPYRLYRKGEDEIPYRDKLKRRLDEVLVSDEDRENIEKVFKAMIFLSYRKVDRREAQQLMRLLHSDPECEDVAIWYDEFLIPGEDFNDAIQTAMGKSDLFVLNVTDRLLEMWEGKPNYVMAQEYPNARTSGKPIIPVEMRNTDRDELREHYEGIDEGFVSLDEHDQVPQELLRALESIKESLKDKHKLDPEIKEEDKNYYIGLAYLGGVNMEQDSERARTYLEKAAGVGMVKAMKRLSVAYKAGEMGEIDYDKAAEWLNAAVELEARLVREQTDYSYLDELKEDCFALWDHYDSVKDDAGRNFCRDVIEGSLYPLFDKADNDHRDRIAEIILESTYRSKNINLCSEILKHYHSTEGAENCIKWIRLGCNSALRLGINNYVAFCSGAVASLEKLYRESVDDETLFEMYLLMTKGYRVNTVSPGIQKMPSGNYLRISREYYENDVPGWSYANKALSLAEEAHSKNPSDIDWEIRLADIRYELGQTIAIAANDLPDDFIDDDILDMKNDLLEQASAAYIRLAEESSDKEKVKQYVEYLTRSAYKRIFSDPLSRKAVSGISDYRKAIEMAERLCQEENSRENLLFLWDTVIFCCGMNIGYDFPDKAIHVAKMLDDMDHNVASKLRLADAYTARVDLNYRREGEFEKVVADNNYYDSSLIERNELEKIDDIERITSIYKEILERAGELPSGIIKMTCSRLTGIYLSVPDCDDGMSYNDKAYKLIHEGLEHIEKYSELKWNWYVDWKQLYGKLNDGDPGKLEGSAFTKWVDMLDRETKEYLSDTCGDHIPEWIGRDPERRHRSILERNEIYHVLFVYAVKNNDSLAIRDIVSKMGSWYEKGQYHDEKYTLPRWTMDHFKIVNSMEDKSDEEMLLEIYNKAISAGTNDIMEKKGDLLAVLDRKEEAIEAYSVSITKLEEVISKLEKKEKIQEALIRTGIAKRNPETEMLIKGMKKRVQEIEEKIKGLKAE